MSKKILITGGAGFIGSNLYDKLSLDNEITIVDNLKTGNLNNLPKNFKILVKDINNLKPKELCGIDIVFHCAAMARVQPSIKNPIYYHKTNVSGTLNLLECCVKSGIKKLIYSSSSSVYGNAKIFPTPEDHPTNPISPYALQKLIGEQYCKLYSELYGLETVCLRYFNVYGKKMPLNGSYRTVLGIFQDLKLKGKKLTITNDGNQKRDFTNVEDVVEANILAMNSELTFNGECLNIGRGHNYSINEIADAFGVNTEYIGQAIEPNETLADINKAKKFLGWNPKQSVIDWIKTL